MALLSWVNPPECAAACRSRNRNPVVFPKRLAKGRKLQRVNHETVAVEANSTSNTAVMGAFENGEAIDGLRRRLQTGGNYLLEVGNKLPALGGNQHVDIHQRGVYANGIVRHALRLFRGSRAVEEDVLGFSLGDRVRANVAPGPPGPPGVLLRLGVVVAWRRLDWVVTGPARKQDAAHGRAMASAIASIKQLKLCGLQCRLSMGNLPDMINPRRK